MARRYVLIDDYDGKELDQGTQPLRLALGRRAWNLYLSDDNTSALYEALEPFVKEAEPAQDSYSDTRAAAAPAGTRQRRSGADRAEADRIKATKKAQRDDMAAWAKQSNENDKTEYKVPGDRGRIQAELVDAYYAANPEAERVW